jgi:hypothetical protein
MLLEHQQHFGILRDSHCIFVLNKQAWGNPWSGGSPKFAYTQWLAVQLLTKSEYRFIVPSTEQDDPPSKIGLMRRQG